MIHRSGEVHGSLPSVEIGRENHVLYAVPNSFGNRSQMSLNLGQELERNEKVAILHRPPDSGGRCKMRLFLNLDRGLPNIFIQYWNSFIGRQGAGRRDRAEKHGGVDLAGQDLRVNLLPGTSLDQAARRESIVQQ